MVAAPQKYMLTVDDYHRMGEAGILSEDDRVELLDGEIWLKAPIGNDHSGGLRGLDYVFNAAVRGRAIVDTQNPIRLSDYSEPQPDLVLLMPRADFYRSAMPRPEDVLLLVEVADSSLAFDCTVKLPRYARDGIREVWIVDLVHRRIETYNAPVDGVFTETAVVARGQSVSPRAFPDVTIAVTDVLG